MKKTLLPLLCAGLGVIALNSHSQTIAAPVHEELLDRPRTALGIVVRVNKRLAGRSVSRKIEMTMTDKSGRSRRRLTGSFRKYETESLRSVLYYLSPQSVKGSAFLTFDYTDPSREDDQWLYLPSLRRARRISASDRGDYFMGTDFTFDDVKHETDLSVDDYAWQLDRNETDNSTPYVILLGRPTDKATAKALGYGRIRVWIATDTWIPVRTDYWDNEDEFLKTIRVSEIEKVDGIWTPHRIEAVRHKDGHRTVFVITDTNYRNELDDLVFTKRSLDTIPSQLR